MKIKPDRIAIRGILADKLIAIYGYRHNNENR